MSWLSAQRVERLARALVVSTVERREIVFDEKSVPESVYILLSGIARITCRNRKGQRRLVIMVAPGMIATSGDEIIFDAGGSRNPVESRRDISPSARSP